MSYSWIVTQHEHPLHLIDLQPKFPRYEEEYDDNSNVDDDDDGDQRLITQKDFRCRQCNRCDKEINWFHRYYYECTNHSCDYSLHKFCGDLPLTFKHTSHPDHTLTLSHYTNYTWYCALCQENYKSGFCYECLKCYKGNKSDFEIHANCVIQLRKDLLIYHPSHIHPLATIPEPILSDCNACGKKHNGTFYFCTTCFKYCIHSDCAFLPKTLRIQKTTNDIFSHYHSLILSYSFPKADEKAKHNLRCKVCNKIFENESLWIYKCEKCRYYTHLDCATSRDIISSFGEMGIVTQHEHPLHLIDLQPKFPHYEEEYDDDSNDDDDDDRDHRLITQKDFRCRQCDRCRKEINWFHRYYYEYTDRSCDYSLHKFCGDLPLTLKHTSHPDHTLTLRYYTSNKWYCVLCRTKDRSGFYYECFKCYFRIHANCVMASIEDRLIYHPSHIHPLAATLKPILFDCNACGKNHKGTFYLCTTCFNFWIHSDCAFLPKTLRIQETTNNKIFSHNHPLILSYSFQKEDQEAKHNPRCRVCNEFFENESIWIYKCEKCRYFTHLDCATSKDIISSFGKRLIKNYKELDNLGLVHLPFPNESYSMLKHLFFKKEGYETNESNLRNFHQHPLTLVHTRECSNDISKPSSSSSTTNVVVSCHDPMNKTELLCNGCVRPITSKPFYKCADEDENCNFFLHEWCTQVPMELKNYPDHPQHPLFFHPNVPDKSFSIFRCDVCRLWCNGFAYSCVECDYHIDVKCGFIPKKITHDAHPGHILSRVQRKYHSKYCRLCVYGSYGDPFSFLCHTCNVFVHVNCALLLAREIRHKCDKHPLSLTYFPAENHKGDYICEVCEEELNPEQCFYHCYKCVQSIHSTCAPVKVEFERARVYYKGVYKFVNIKFGGIHNNVEGHPHPLLFAQGIDSDGRCVRCDYSLKYKMIFKCQQYKFAFHLKCCQRLMSKR